MSVFKDVPAEEITRLNRVTNVGALMYVSQSMPRPRTLAIPLLPTLHLPHLTVLFEPVLHPTQSVAFRLQPHRLLRRPVEEVSARRRQEDVHALAALDDGT